VEGELELDGCFWLASARGPLNLEGFLLLRATSHAEMRGDEMRGVEVEVLRVS
jgi:hypothetical protein